MAEWLRGPLTPEFSLRPRTCISVLHGCVVTTDGNVCVGEEERRVRGTQEPPRSSAGQSWNI